ncbi:hypothetical protein Tco_1066182, partial [Tanacetum coccineum]
EPYEDLDDEEEDPEEDPKMDLDEEEEEEDPEMDVDNKEEEEPLPARVRGMSHLRSITQDIYRTTIKSRLKLIHWI